ncbi:MAG: DUF1320 family protein [Rhodothermales bacterium]|nr:DUF1320 family protein [Rhodothermales bacterium]
MRRFLVLCLSALFCAASAASLSAAPSPTTAMAYCTAQDVTDAYPTDRLAEVTGDATGQAVDSTKLEAAVTDYAQVIAASARVQRPDAFEATGHPVLKVLNVEGAYLLLKKRSSGGLDEDALKAEKRLDDQLARIASGTLRLETETTPTAEYGDPANLFRGRTRLFTR